MLRRLAPSVTGQVCGQGVESTRFSNPCLWATGAPKKKAARIAPGGLLGERVRSGRFAVNGDVDLHHHIGVQGNVDGAFAHELDRAIRHANLGLRDLVALFGQFFSDVVVGDRAEQTAVCLLYTSPSPRDGLLSRMPSSA